MDSLFQHCPVKVEFDTINPHKRHRMEHGRAAEEVSNRTSRRFPACAEQRVHRTVEVCRIHEQIHIEHRSQSWLRIDRRDEPQSLQRERLQTCITKHLDGVQARGDGEPVRQRGPP